MSILITIGPSFSFSFPGPFFPRSFAPDVVAKSILDYPDSLAKVLLRPSLFTAATCGVFWIVHSEKFQRYLQQRRSHDREAYWRNLERQRSQPKTRENISQQLTNFVTDNWLWKYTIGWLYRGWKQLVFRIYIVIHYVLE